MSDSSCTNLKYNKLKMYEKFDNQLKEIDEEYRTAIITFAMAKIMDMHKTEQNKVALYLFNCIN